MKTIIHIILGKANPNRMNGVNKVVYQLGNAQKSIGANVEVWGITKNINAPCEYQRDYKLRLFRKRKNPFGLDKDLVESIKAQNESVVFHLHGGFLPEMFALSRILVRNGFNYVFTPHGSYNLVALRKNNFVKWIYLRLFEKALLKGAKYVHLIGESESASMDSLKLGCDRVLIPNGQHVEEGVNIEKDRKSNGIRFGFMGRFTIHTKGLDLLLQAFRIYKSRHHGKAELYLIGSGGEIDKLEQLVEDLHLKDDVIFTGAKYGKEKTECLHDLTAFFHTSRNEGLPGAVLEALALGIPCVVSKETNLREYIKESEAGIGLLKNTPEIIAAAMFQMEQIHQTKSLKIMSSNASQLVRNEFNWKQIAERFYQEVYS
jgi:glycosyltransferase involved in cell wall biosynthesis